ncbi:MAG: histidinol-phosphatase HisJ family protein [Coriobacteriia bacterium]|nr:histidinol-phosphatase HisJ family protein [Coriobacteriia bacterium]
MRRLADCHMHTELCGHAVGTPTDMLRAVQNAGLLGAVMTEHLPLKPELDPEGIYAMRGDVDTLYVAELRDLRFDWDGADLVIGAEADWLSTDLAWTAESVRQARACGVEVVLGSVHFLDGWAFDDPNYLEEWDKRDVDAVWEDYFTQWCAAASSGLYDVMSHPDLVKKFGHRASNEDDFYAEAARVAGQSGVLVEVSTAGWRKPVKEQYPSVGFIKRFIENGVHFTLGSDAHDPAEVGYRLNDAADILASLGETRIAYPQREGNIRWLDL